MPFYYKPLAVSVCVIVVAVILYFVPGDRIRIPAMVFCALACFLALIGVWVIGCIALASTGNESRRFLKDRWAEAAAQEAEKPKKAGTVLAVKARTRKKAIPTPRTDLKRKQRA